MNLLIPLPPKLLLKWPKKYKIEGSMHHVRKQGEIKAAGE